MLWGHVFRFFSNLKASARVSQPELHPLGGGGVRSVARALPHGPRSQVEKGLRHPGPRLSSAWGWDLAPAP